MDIGLFAIASNPFATPEYLHTLAVAAEERGFHSLWVPEHVVLFDEYESQYPYAADGRLPAPSEAGPLDPFPTLAFLAAATRRIRLGTGICLVPQRNPVYTAKEVATVDWLSNGRFDFGVGIGWLAEEFHALGVPFERRAARTRDYLELMRRCWSDPVSAYEGEFYSLPPCRLFPKPVQKPHPPIIFGGESDPALRRVADLGQGWFGFSLDPQATAERLAFLDRALGRRGRTRREIRVLSCPYLKRANLDLVKRYREAGVDEVVLVALGTTRDALLATLDSMARDIADPARAL